MNISVHQILSQDSGLTHRFYVHIIREIYTQHTFPSVLPHPLFLIHALLFTFNPFSPSLSLSLSSPLVPHTLYLTPSFSLSSLPSPSATPLSLTFLSSLSPTSTQTTRVSLQRSASSLACRGLIHSYDPLHTSVVGGNKWRPLHKPQWIGVNRKVGRNCMYSIF